MATVTTTPETQPLLAQRRFLSLGFFWGAAVLAILAGWLRTKYLGIPDLMVWGLWLMAAGSLVLAIVQWKRPTQPEAAALEWQRRTVGVILIVAGLVLVPVALWLLLGQGLTALGEGLGLITLACIALGAGAKLNSAPGAVSFQERF